MSGMGGGKPNQTYKINKKGIVKKATGRRYNNSNIISKDPIKLVEDKLMKYIQDEIAELILLREDKLEAVSRYGMGYEAEAELPYRARL